jgi:hypothetical protein
MARLRGGPTGAGDRGDLNIAVGSAFAAFPPECAYRSELLGAPFTHLSSVRRSRNRRIRSSGYTSGTVRRRRPRASALRASSATRRSHGVTKTGSHWAKVRECCPRTW